MGATKIIKNPQTASTMPHTSDTNDKRDICGMLVHLQKIVLNED